MSDGRCRPFAGAAVPPNPHKDLAVKRKQFSPATGVSAFLDAFSPGSQQRRRRPSVGDPAWLSKAGAVALGLAAVDGFHGPGVTEGEGDGVVAAGVGEPVPAVHALAADDQAVAEGPDGSEEGFGGGGQVAAEAGLAVAVKDDEEEGPGVQDHTSVESDVGGRLEAAHGEGLRVRVMRREATNAPPSSQARAFMSIQPLQRTGTAITPSRGKISLPAAPAAERVVRPAIERLSMHASQADYKELFDSIHERDRLPAYPHARPPGSSPTPPSGTGLRPFASGSGGEVPPAQVEDLSRLYALGRVNEVLLLRFQRGRADGTDWPGPKVSLDEYVWFAESLGMTVAGSQSFSPFYHEIVEVAQADNEEQPVTVLDLLALPYARRHVVLAGRGARLGRQQVCPQGDR